jgi:polysaccharide biosynthesis PFTS motif protein
VAYNDFSINHVIRNILFNQHGIKTWYYLHTCHFIYAFLPQTKSIPDREIEWSYMYYDNLVSWNDKLTRYFDIHPTAIKKYVNIGSLWSEHVRMISDGELESNILKDMKNKMNVLPDKIISVFDTTFGPGVPLQPNDMVLFIEGIIRLLDNHPDIGVIFKEKMDWEELTNIHHDKAILSAYEKLKGHNRCYVIGSRYETAEVIAASDLVISACFTSCTIETLGARKKAIYFDATNKFESTYYDSFPKLIAHGFSELENLVNYWLYEVKENDFENYVQKHVIDELDAHADGRAITRFRELLAQ